jgi:uncharacterized caspase-like protein
VKAVIAIGLEKHADAALGPRKYAAADARAFASALKPLGFAPANRKLLLIDKATKAAIEEAVADTLDQLGEDDTLCFYYGGHAFSELGDNFLTCYDTLAGDPELTSLDVAWLFRQIQASKCCRIALFLDIGHRSSTGHPDHSPLGDPPNDEHLKALLDASDGIVCLSASKADEASHTSASLKHGIWTHHIVEALEGKASTALQGWQLTAGSLQNHLSRMVPITLRRTNPQSVQTPWVHGLAKGDFPLADLEKVAAKRLSASDLQASQIKSVSLLSEKSASVKSLSGFAKKKGHFLPDRRSDNAQGFINDIAAADLETHLEQIRTALKREFRFKRLELSVENPGEGAATITTPYFNYNVDIRQAPDTTSEVVWRRWVDEIVSPDQVLSSQFDVVFAGMFNTVEFTLHGQLDLEELVDRVEEQESDAIEIDYPDDLSSCELRLKNIGAEIHVTPSTFAVVHRHATTAKQLLESFFSIQSALKNQHALGIPFGP